VPEKGRTRRQRFSLRDEALIADLLQHPRVLETRTHIHHRIPKYDHLRRTAYVAYRLSALLHADQNCCVRAAILHDIDSRLGTLRTHGAIAAHHAAQIGESDAVCCAITSHMYPLGPAPTTREGWVLALADKLAWLLDVSHLIGDLATGRSLRVWRYLRQHDPFFQ
jgi:glycyl-tRNA synthetase beta chain